MKTIKKYKVTYQNGGGVDYNDGDWIVTKTPKIIIAEKIKHFMSGVYSMHNIGEKIRIGQGTGNPMKHEQNDGSFIVYFSQAGIPYIFEPILE